MSAGCCHHQYGTKTDKATNVTLVVNIVLLVLIGTTAFFTRSSAMFSEAVHRAFDAMNPLILWLGYRRSKRPSDAKHPLGHTREAFIYALAAAVLMLGAGAGVSAYHGITSLIEGHEPRMHAWFPIIAIISIVLEGFSLWVSYQALEGKGVSSTKNTTALGLIVENSIDILGILFAFIAYGVYVYTGWAACDAIGSLLIAGLMAYSSFYLIRKNISLLTGEAADEETNEDIKKIVLGSPYVMKVVGMEVSMTGPENMCCMLSVILDGPKMLDAYSLQTEGKHTGREAVVWTMLRMSIIRNEIKRRIAKKYPGMQFIHVECS